MNAIEVSEAQGHLGPLLENRLVTGDDVKVAQRALSGQRTVFGFSKFERNAAVARHLYTRFGRDLPPEIYRAALFYESNNTSRLSKKARSIAEAANALSQARGNPQELAEKLIDLSSTDAFLINGTALLLGLRRVASDKAHPGRTNERLRTELMRIAETALKFYAPTADILGFRAFRAEIGETAFRLLKPRLYNKLDRDLSKMERKLTLHAVRLEPIIREHADKLGFHYRISPRPRKQVYSAFEKMQRKSLASVRELNDVVGFRIVLYPPAHASGIEKVRELSNRIERDPRLRIVDSRDYLGPRKKPNSYEAKHLMIAEPRTGLTAEVQLQTEEMEQRANDKQAAHALHKQSSLDIDSVARIQAIGRNAMPELASSSLMDVKVTFSDAKGSQTRNVKIYPGAPLLTVAATALQPHELANGIRFELRRGSQRIRAPSLYHFVEPSSEVHIFQDPRGVKPSARWLEITRHHPNVRQAFDLLHSQSKRR